MPLHKNTPLVKSRRSERVWIKLDNLQPSGSFKIRGVGRLCEKAVASGAKHLVSSSGGNAGLASAYAGKELGMKVTVFLPSTSPLFIQERLKADGATVHIKGSVWDEANQHAIEFTKENEGCVLIHPFDHPDIWEGHASIVEELHQELKTKPAAIVASVGGGGLILGLLQGLEKVGWSDVQIIAVETEGSASLDKTIKAGHSVTLDGINTIARSLGAKTLAPELVNRVLSKNHNITPVVVSDAEAFKALVDFLDNHYMLVEPACSASMAAALYHSDVIKGDGPIVVIACGGSLVSFDSLQQWKVQFAE